MWSKGPLLGGGRCLKCSMRATGSQSRAEYTALSLHLPFRWEDAPGLINGLISASKKRQIFGFGESEYFTETVARPFEDCLMVSIMNIQRFLLRCLKLSMFASANSRAVFTPQNIHWMFFGTAVSLSRSKAVRRLRAEVRSEKMRKMRLRVQRYVNEIGFCKFLGRKMQKKRIFVDFWQKNSELLE